MHRTHLPATFPHTMVPWLIHNAARTGIQVLLQAFPAGTDFSLILSDRLVISKTFC